jgi:hypothetical protein
MQDQMLKQQFNEALKEILPDEQESSDLREYIASRCFEIVVNWLPQYIAESTAKCLEVDLRAAVREEVGTVLTQILSEMKVKND